MSRYSYLRKGQFPPQTTQKPRQKVKKIGSQRFFYCIRIAYPLRVLCVGVHFLFLPVSELDCFFALVFICTHGVCVALFKFHAQPHAKHHHKHHHKPHRATHSNIKAGTQGRGHTNIIIKPALLDESKEKITVCISLSISLGINQM